MPVYEYQGVHYELADGLSNEQALSKIKSHLGVKAAPAKKERTTVGEDIAQGIAGVGNLADTFGTMAVGGARTLLGQNKEGKLDPMFADLAERKKSRADWAGGQGKEKGVSGAVISALAGLPGMVLAPVSGLERAADLMDKGVPLREAGPAGAIDSALSTGSALLPILGKTLLGKGVTGGLGNAATGAASDVATQAIVKDKNVGREYDPLSLERRASEFILGAGGGVLTGKTKPTTRPPGPVNKSLADLDTKLAKAKETVAMPEQMELDLTTSPQQIAEMQARATGQRDMFAPVNEPLARNVPETSPRQIPEPIDAMRQNELFDQDAQGLTSNPYGANMGDWRVDENGMPIRADLSMELANLEQPLQRNLWGDELQPRVDPIGQSADLFDSQRQFNEQGVQGGIPLTQAMDSMEPKAMRAAVEQTQMGRELPASPELEAARMQADTAPLRSADPSMYVPRGQRGAINLGAATEATPEKKRIALLTIDSPEVTDARQQLSMDNKRSIAAKISGIEGYRNNIDTPEKVIAAAEYSKDLTPAQRIRGETVTPGINALAIDSNNPLVKFVREKTRSVFQEAESLARQYITDKETGIGTLLNKLSQAEKNDMVHALQIGDRNERYLTRAELEGRVTENTIQAVEKFYEMDRKKLEVWNEAREAVGMEPVSERPGHFPGVFKGDYKQIVTMDGKVVGVIAVDSTRQLKRAQESLKKEFPDAKFSNVDRRSLGGNGRKADMFSGMNDVLTMLAKNDPEFAKVQELISKAVKDNADALYGAAFHSMQKKGVIGNEGNKPWMDQNDNTNAAIKAYLEYWEEGILSHKNLPVEAEIKGLMDNAALDGMDNAKQYVNSYIRNMTGRDLGAVGDALNKLLDAPFKAVGVGPSVPREVVNQLNKRLGQQTMGFFNWMFSAVQFLQMPQMAFPEMIKVANELNLPSANITN